MRHIFLTGGTGVIGSALISQLLRDEDLRLTVLVRATSPNPRELSDDEYLQIRANKLLDFCALTGSKQLNRIQFVKGDVCAQQLGLNADDYDEIKQTATGIIHCAGNVKLNQSIEDARRNTVVPVQEILKLVCIAQRMQKVDVVSTIGVAGRSQGLIPEQELATPRKFHNNYEQAKAEAEVLVWNAIDNGMPVTIHRPSMVVGDSRNGAIPYYQVFYHLCDFLTGYQTFGCLPDFGDATLDIVPVDYVAGAISFSAVHESDVGRVLHLCAGDTPELRLRVLSATVKSIYESLGRSCYPQRIIPVKAFALLTQIASWIGTKKARSSARRLQYFLPYLGQQQRFSVRSTVDLLTSRRIVSIPPVEYLPRVLATYLSDVQQTVPQQNSIELLAQLPDHRGRMLTRK